MNVRLPLRDALLLLLPSAAVFLAGVTLATSANGQPQGKKKAQPTQVHVATLAEGLWHPWSLACLPNGDMLVTERNGRLRILRDGLHGGKLDPEPIAGVPQVHAVRLSGLLCAPYLRHEWPRGHPGSVLFLKR